MYLISVLLIIFGIVTIITYSCGHLQVMDALCRLQARYTAPTHTHTLLVWKQLNRTLWHLIRTNMISPESNTDNTCVSVHVFSGKGEYNVLRVLALIHNMFDLMKFDNLGITFGFVPRVT